eukprot:4616262-Prymnesium_polylepis.2
MRVQRERPTAQREEQHLVGKPVAASGSCHITVRSYRAAAARSSQIRRGGTARRQAAAGGARLQRYCRRA